MCEAIPNKLGPQPYRLRLKVKCDCGPNDWVCSNQHLAILVCHGSYICLCCFSWLIFVFVNVIPSNNVKGISHNYKNPYLMAKGIPHVWKRHITWSCCVETNTNWCLPNTIAYDTLSNIGIYGKWPFQCVYQNMKIIHVKVVERCIMSDRTRTTSLTSYPDRQVQLRDPNWVYSGYGQHIPYNKRLYICHQGLVRKKYHLDMRL